MYLDAGGSGGYGFVRSYPAHPDTLVHADRNTQELEVLGATKLEVLLALQG